VTAVAQPVGTYTVIVTQGVSDEKHTEDVAIIEGDNDTYMFHRALGDTVTIQEGFKMGELYCFRDFRSGGSVTVCRIEDDGLYGLVLHRNGDRETIAFNSTDTLKIDNRDITGLYRWQAEPYIQAGPANTLSIHPGDGCWLLELNYGNDQFTEIKGFGIAADGILVAAMDLVENNTTWNLNAYRFDEGGNAQGRWMTRAVIEPSQEIKTYTGEDRLELIQESGK